MPLSRLCSIHNCDGITKMARCNFLQSSGKFDFFKGRTKERKRKVFIFALIFSGILFFQLTGITTSGITQVKKFISVLTEILSEFTLNISRNINDTKILVWTRKAPLKYFYVTTGDRESLQKANFNCSHPTKILIHGFSDRGVTTWIKTFKKHYLDTGEYNIVSVDWRPLAESPWYTTAAKNAIHVGKFIAEFIHFLVSEGVSYQSIHVLGSSLGAQVAGYVGHFTNGRIARITGLDPSGPLFHTVPRSDRLDSSDAQFVDVIHTAGKWVGNDEIIGHVDFFPNTGRAPQPGCEGKESLDLTCSHFKAWQMYGETIEPGAPKILAIKCSNFDEFESGLCCNAKHLETAPMGEVTPNTTKGTFFLVTNQGNPHAKPFQESVKCPWIMDP